TVRTPSGPLAMGMLPSSPAQPLAPPRGTPFTSIAAPIPVPAITTAAVTSEGASWHSSTRAAVASLTIANLTPDVRGSGGRQPTTPGITSQATTEGPGPTRPGI